MRNYEQDPVKYGFHQCPAGELQNWLQAQPTSGDYSVHIVSVTQENGLFTIIYVK